MPEVEKVSEKVSAKVRGILETLLVVFIVLKLTGEIDWSWRFVLMPFWIPLVFGLFCLLLWGILTLIEEKCEHS